jgi:hypothetical protein
MPSYLGIGSGLILGTCLVSEYTSVIYFGAHNLAYLSIASFFAAGVTKFTQRSSINNLNHRVACFLRLVLINMDKERKTTLAFHLGKSERSLMIT